MKHFLEFVVRSLVDNPDDVQISEVGRRRRGTYRIGLHPADVGLIIGKGGRTISAIRSVINAANKAGILAVEVVENTCRSKVVENSTLIPDFSRFPPAVRIDVITLFPEIVSGPLDASILGRAQRGGQVEIVLHQLRDYATDKHRTSWTTSPTAAVPACCSSASRFSRRWRTCRRRRPSPARHLLTRAAPSSTRPRRANWRRWIASSFICGHYEGVDERVREHLVEEELSHRRFRPDQRRAGRAGGHRCRRAPPAQRRRQRSQHAVRIVQRMERPGLEGPQYTRPEEFRGWRVPEILLSGHHGKIEQLEPRAEPPAHRDEVRPDLLTL